MPTLFDFAFGVATFVIVTIVEAFVFFPRFKRALGDGEPDARLRAYRRAVLAQWLFAAIVVVAWLRLGRPFGALGLAPPAPSDWRTIVSIGIVGLISLFSSRQMRAIARATPARLDAIRPKLSRIEFILPHNAAEYRWFLLLSLTAGVCEELLYRGYLVWILRPYIGVPGGMLVGVLLFGIGHAYQGRSGAIKATLAGVAMSIVVLATGWLIPAMIVHALVDAHAGILGFRVLRPRPSVAVATV